MVGLAPDGGRLSPAAREEVLEAVDLELHVDSGLHDFLSERPEFKARADKRGVVIRDVMSSPSSGCLTLDTGLWNIILGKAGRSGETRRMTVSTKKSLAGAVILLIVFLSGLTALGSEQVRVGILPVVDTLPLIVAEEEGLFKEEGLDLELVSFQSAMERDVALQAGRLEGCFGDLLNTLLLAGAGADLRIVTTAFHTNEDHRMFGVVGAPESAIANPEDLRGKKVAVSRATVIEYLLDRLLKSAGLAEDYVVKEEIKKIPVRLQVLLANRVPAALLPEPLLTLAEQHGGNVVLDDRRLDTTLTVVALRNEFLGGEQGRGRAFVRAYARAVSRINRNPESYRALLVERTRFPEQVGEVYRVPLFPEVNVPPERDVRRVGAWMVSRGLSGRVPPYREVVWQAGIR